MSGREAWTPGQREEQLEQLRTAATHWHMIIVGGGITGAGIAREAARRGLKVLLVERQDFAWGTSSRSSKMVHGGLRYMAAGDIRTTMHSVHERERLMTEVPGLVDRMDYMMAHYHGVFPGPLAFNSLLFIYDFFAGKRYRQFLPAAVLAKQNPLLKTERLSGGTRFADAVTDDARLVIRVLREAQRDGAVLLNYVGASRLLFTDGKVSGAELQDSLSGACFSAGADVVINATGAWADVLRAELGREKKIRPARGSHIVIPAERLPLSQSFTVLHPQDKRPVFIYPWEGRTVIGTTDLDNNGISNAEVAMTGEELTYLLAAVDYQFPAAQIRAEDIISSWAGVRPLVSSGALNPSKEKREHSIWDDNGLVSVSGGKLTTFRLIALDVLDCARKYIADYPDGHFSEQIFTAFCPDNALLNTVAAQYRQRLSGHYGAELPALLSLAGADELEAVADTHTLWAELRWAAAHEAVVHLDDLLLRRTRLGLLLAQGGLDYEEKIRSICQPLLGWDDDRWRWERERYREICRQYYSVPEH